MTIGSTTKLCSKKRSNSPKGSWVQLLIHYVFLFQDEHMGMCFDSITFGRFLNGKELPV